MDAFIITMALSARAIQHGAHRHDRRGIYRCVLLRFRGRIEIDHSYGLRCRGLCCHSRHSTRGPAGAAASGRAGRPTSAVPGVAAQTTTAQTVSWSIPITFHMNLLRTMIKPEQNKPGQTMSLFDGLYSELYVSGVYSVLSRFCWHGHMDMTNHVAHKIPDQGRLWT